MSDKTELPKEWQQEAERKYPVSDSQHPAVLEHNTNQQNRQNVFTDGAKAYRDEVEKMLKDKHDTWADVRKNTDKSNVWELCNAKINVIEDLIYELKSLTPTQDGK